MKKFTAVVYRVNQNLTDERERFEFPFTSSSDKEKVIREGVQKEIERTQGKWMLGYHVEIFNENGLILTAFNINYDL